VATQEYEVVTGVTFDAESCKIQMSFATVRGVGSGHPKKLAITEVNADYTPAYGP
jgi:hypothetical protein